ncbi:zinc-dependent metalloprotease [Flavobacterium sp. N1994]|uniref:zinc-dependent metalloprotease n=1 Tax=Flavobacterium sp. N1994 TaxID=2986827 RepID=UPI002221E642|nr:zinc-dependent metalloprotease family protein [Flavobacterium sp. N1994]
MKKIILLLSISFSLLSNAQSDRIWKPYSGLPFTKTKNVNRLSFPKTFDLYELNFDNIKQVLNSAPDRYVSSNGVILTIPNTNGQLEHFKMFEASNFTPELQSQFPEIRAYVGIGVEDPHAQLRLSISPQGIQTMVSRADKASEFMEPYATDANVYVVYNSARNKAAIPFVCSTTTEPKNPTITGKSASTNRSNSGTLKNVRLALSCNGEYAAYFGASTAGNATDKAKVLAAFNATLSRCNGVYEKDLAIHMNLVAQTTNVIYCNPSTDPYSTNLNSWNAQLQNTLSTKLTGASTTLAANNAAYDIGHMFGATGGGGNAGCIGCVCVDDTSSTTDLNKGSGITSPADGVPMGDNFDIDYVVHEMGHQMGANHTFSDSSEGTGVNMEIGSGITIMGYAGITNYDAAQHSIDIYHAASIGQIQTYMNSTSCPTEVTLANAAPVVNAGTDYTIPKSTPFVLTGAATSTSPSVLTYCWEQYDNCGSQTGANSVAKVTKTIGPNWISYTPSALPYKYFPVMATVLANAQTTIGDGSQGIAVEALNSVARVLNFRLTVRDNVAGGGETNFDDMKVTVDATKGPFTVTSQSATGISYPGNSTQTVTWNVASTSTLAGASTVDIYLATNDDGTNATFSTLVASALPNNGSASIVVPNIQSSTCRFMVKASGNVFFNVNTQDFTITAPLATTQLEMSNFTLYPNPNKGNFTVQFNSSSTNDIAIDVFDIRGRSIFQKVYSNTGFFSQNVDMNLVESGVYLVSVKDGDKKVVKKIFIN